MQECYAIHGDDGDADDCDANVCSDDDGDTCDDTDDCSATEYYRENWQPRAMTKSIIDPKYYDKNQI